MFKYTLLDIKTYRKGRVTGQTIHCTYLHRTVLHCVKFIPHVCKPQGKDKHLH